MTYRLICTYSEICLTKHRPLKITLKHTQTFPDLGSSVLHLHFIPRENMSICVRVLKGSNCLQILYSPTTMHTDRSLPGKPFSFGFFSSLFPLLMYEQFHKTCTTADAFLIFFFIEHQRLIKDDIKPFYSLQDLEGPPLPK